MLRNRMLSQLGRYSIGLTVPFDPGTGPAKETKTVAPHDAASSTATGSSKVPLMIVTAECLLISTGSLLGLRV